jgi:hypothetical protein
MMSTQTQGRLQSEAVAITCGECGITFSVPERWQAARMKSHETFWCPNGHPRAFLGKTAEERELERLRRDRDYLRTAYREASAEADAARRSLAATKGVLTRTRNRIAQGKCPHCRAEFPDLAAHIQERHAAEADAG